MLKIGAKIVLKINWSVETPWHEYMELRVMGSGARLSNVPVTLRARNQIFKTKYKE